MAGIDEEVQKYRIIPRDVKERLFSIMLPAEYYLFERASNGKKFDEDFITKRYKSVFDDAKEECRVTDKKLGIMFGKKYTDKDYDMNGYEKAKEYLLYRMNGGSDEMFERFSGFRQDIQLMLMSVFQPAELYLEERIKEAAEEGEHSTPLSLAGPDRWHEYEKVKYQVSLFIGWDAPKERQVEGGYDTVLDYVTDRLLL